MCQIKLTNNFKIGETESFADFRKKYDATIVAIGAWTSSGMRCKGEKTGNVFGGIDFLREVALGNKPDIGKNVAIVGGGNTAMDACRTAVRLGAENVYVIYRRTQAEMPAEAIEIEEAKEEIRKEFDTINISGVDTFITDFGSFQKNLFEISEENTHCKQGNSDNQKNGTQNRIFMH